MLNLPMLRRGLHRLLARRFVDIKSLAAERWVICKGEDVEVPPAKRLDGEMDKVLGLCNWRNWDTERLLLDGGVVHHAPSEAYLVRGARLMGAFVYAGAAKHQPGYGEENLWVRGLPRRQHIQRASLIANNSGSYFFGNFLWDDIPLSLLEQDASRHIRVPKKPYAHEDGYRELLGVGKPPVIENAYIEELVLFTDFAQNASKEARLRLLRSRLRQTLNGQGARQPRPGVYIRRGITGERRIMENEAEIEAHLERQGFTVIDPSVMTAREIASAALDARLIIGIEGSHMAHALYTIADKGTLLILQPPMRFCLVHKEFTDRLGMSYAFVVGERSPRGFIVRPDALQRAIDGLCS